MRFWRASHFNAKIALLSAHSVRGVVWRVSTHRNLPLAAELADPAVQLRLLLSLPSSVCLQVRFSRSEAGPCPLSQPASDSQPVLQPRRLGGPRRFLFL